MTFTRDNIVGVEFTVVSEGKRIFTVGRYGKSGSPVIWWNGLNGKINRTEAYTAATIAHYLNNGTWIVKNSKV